MPLSALTHFLTGTYTVTRPGSGSYTNGIWTPGAGSTFNIDASIQPINVGDLRRVEQVAEGFNISDLKKLYTTTELRVGDSDSMSDTVAIGAETWRVIAVEHHLGWDSNGHYKATIAKIGAL